MSVAQNKLEKELAAKKKRLQAQAYLEKQGQSVGPISLKTIEENKKRSDNTLELLLRDKATNMNKSTEKSFKSALLIQQSIGREEFVSKPNSSVIVSSWTEVFDTVSQKPYFWNTVTNETKWERPTEIEDKVAPAAVVPPNLVNGLPLNWIEKIHTATKQTFYMNTITGATSFTKPTSETQIKGGTIVLGQATNPTIQERPVQPEPSHKRVRLDFDSLDPAKGRGTGGGVGLDGRMADSTASGPLWQQRPYPAPSQVVKSQKLGSQSASIGPSAF